VVADQLGGRWPGRENREGRRRSGGSVLVCGRGAGRGCGSNRRVVFCRPFPVTVWVEVQIRGGK
jgi:hypothetical protein